MPVPQYIDKPNARRNAEGPMARQAAQEYEAQRNAAGQEYDIEMRALTNQVLTDEQYNNKAATLHGKHSLKALKMEQDWGQRMTMIKQYEELGASGKMDPQEAERAQYSLSGYNIPKQQKPDLWSEHRNLIQQRDRILQMNDQWDFRKGKWRQVIALHTKGKKKDLPSSWGREASPQEISQIEGVQESVRQLDQYEFALLGKMDPRQRKVNQLSRAMAMGPRVQQTVGVGSSRDAMPLGETKKKKLFQPYEATITGFGRDDVSFETPGYKMTREKAIQQATAQLGTDANRERVMDLAKQIYGAK